MKTKKCSRCLIRFPIDFYTKHKDSVGGVRHKCRNCRTLEVRNWRATGKTTTNEFEAKSMGSLELIFLNLKEAYKIKGIYLYKK